MTSGQRTFMLANSPQCRIYDRFSQLPDDTSAEEDESGRIVFWPLLEHLLRQETTTVSRLVELLDTLAAVSESTRGSHDYLCLRRLFEDSRAAPHVEPFFARVWPNLCDIALDLGRYFPSGRLEQLKPGVPLWLSRGQVACLIVHQFLCTAPLQRDGDGYQDFGIWFGSGQRHPEAVSMYLNALFAYFARLPPAEDLLRQHDAAQGSQDDGIVYKLHSRGRDVSLQGVKLGEAVLEYVDKHSNDSQRGSVQGPTGATVVAANKVIGFGQSATQEEIFVGVTPEACSVVLVAPELAADAVVAVSGARAMLNVTGQRRDLERTFVEPEVGRLIFMDALEMDMVEGADEALPDLHPENLDREIKKATAGFEAHDACDAVWTGLWGCGAFCGDPGVKLLVLWLAAAAAGVTLHLRLSADEQDLGRAFAQIIRAYGGRMAGEVRDVLGRVPLGIRAVEILQWVAMQADRRG